MQVNKTKSWRMCNINNTLSTMRHVIEQYEINVVLSSARPSIFIILFKFSFFVLDDIFVVRNER